MSVGTNGRNLPALTAERLPAEQAWEIMPGPKLTMEEMRYVAKTASASNMYGMNEAQAFMLMMTAEADGMHPVHALRRYHMMEFRGRVTPVMKAEAMLADMMRVGWEHKWTTDNDDRKIQEIWLRHPKKCPDGKSVRYSESDAKAAKLLDGGNKDNWEKHRPNMLRARVVSNACRMLDPGIVLGVYTPEEIQDMKAEEGESRPQSPLRVETKLSEALDAAKRRPALPQEPRPPRSDFRAWLDETMEQFNANWVDVCLDAKVSPGKGVTSYQVVNGLITDWIEEGSLDAALIQNAEGKRDKAKMGAQLKQSWEADMEGVKADVTEYLRGKTETMMREAGIEPIAITEADPDAVEPEAASEQDWEPGRE